MQRNKLVIPNRDIKLQFRNPEDQGMVFSIFGADVPISALENIAYQ